MMKYEYVVPVWVALVNAAYALDKAKETAPDEKALVRINNTLARCGKAIAMMEDIMSTMPSVAFKPEYL